MKPLVDLKCRIILCFLSVIGIVNDLLVIRVYVSELVKGLESGLDTLFFNLF